MSSKGIRVSVTREFKHIYFPVIDIEIKPRSAKLVGSTLWVELAPGSRTTHDRLSKSDRIMMTGDPKGRLVTLEELEAIVNNHPKEDRLVCFNGYRSHDDAYPTFRLALKESSAVVEDGEIKGVTMDGCLGRQSIKGYDRVVAFVCDEKRNKIDGVPEIKGW